MTVFKKNNATRRDSAGAVCNSGMGIFFYVFDFFFEGGGKLNNSRLCIKISSFLYACTCAMPRLLCSTRRIIFSVRTPDNISGLISVFLWLLK